MNRRRQQTTIVPTRTDPWLRKPGAFVFEIRDYFRRPIASGYDAIQATCFVLGRWEDGRLVSDEVGQKVRRPFATAGPGLVYTTRFLAVLGNEGQAVDLIDEDDVSRAIAYRPFIGHVVAGPEEPTEGKPRRFISITEFDRVAVTPSKVWNGRSIERPDPRGSR